jgi:hypothetical protein
MKIVTGALCIANDLAFARNISNTTLSRVKILKKSIGIYSKNILAKSLLNGVNFF